MGTDDDSLDSVKMGIAMGTDVVEIDVRFEQDGTPILSHDKPRPGRKYERVSDAIALLNEAPGVYLNADMKEKNSRKGLSELKSILERYNMKDRMYFSGIERCKSGLLLEYFSEYEYLTDWNMNIIRRHSNSYIQSLVDKAKALGYSGFNLYHRYLTEKMVNFFHEKEMKVYTWTVEKETDMQRLVDWGVDSITTRNPPLLREVLARNGKV